LPGYDGQLQRFAPANIAAEFLARFITLGYTLDQLGTVLGYTLDNLPAPLDSPIWAGGWLQLAVFDTNHQLNYLTGASLPATVETQEMEPVTGRRAMITSSRPLIDGSGSIITYHTDGTIASITPAMSTSIGRRERQVDMINYGQASPLNAFGTCPGRASGRYVRARMNTVLGGDWVNISGVELEMVPQGKR